MCCYCKFLLWCKIKGSKWCGIIKTEGLILLMQESQQHTLLYKPKQSVWFQSQTEYFHIYATMTWLIIYLHMHRPICSPALIIMRFCTPCSSTLLCNTTEYKIAGGDKLASDKCVRLRRLLKIKALILGPDLGVGKTGEDLFSPRARSQLSPAAMSQLPHRDTWLHLEATLDMRVLLIFCSSGRWKVSDNMYAVPAGPLVLCEVFDFSLKSISLSPYEVSSTAWPLELSWVSAKICSASVQPQ